eukprot:TRINITY_DN1763_c0_g1_i1.p1 TRINITY_DN1763_c0_g1~~TRINITY_DN1763_c0_g1_i1.p1  ORF type:complete len:830 (+),score=218.82 TRINITY_DN1763_c0_g1_i1:152-2491(+)
MPAKKKGVKMGLADFTGGHVNDYIPTSTEELEGAKAQYQTEREEREAKRNGPRPGTSSYYGASGEAGATDSWRGSAKQPEAPAGFNKEGPRSFGKFEKAGQLEWGARGGSTSAEQMAKTFGGTGFGSGFGQNGPSLDKEKPKAGPWASLRSSDRSPPRERPQQDHQQWDRPEQSKRYDPLGGSGPQRRKEIVAFGRDAMGTGTTEARSPPRGIGGRADAGYEGFGQRARGQQRQESRGPPVMFSRDAMGAKSPERLDAGERSPQRDQGPKWSAGSGGAQHIRDAVRRRQEAEEQAEEEKKARMAGRLAELEKKAGAERPAQKPALRKQVQGRSWADDDQEPETVEVAKSADGPLGVVCSGDGTLTVVDVRPDSACLRAGVDRFVRTHMLTHVNGEPVGSMNDVRYQVAGKTKVTLTFQPVAASNQAQNGQPQRKERDLSALRGDKKAAAPDDDEEGSVEPDEDFYAHCAAETAGEDDLKGEFEEEYEEYEEYEEDEEEEEEEVFEVGDKVLLTDDGVELINEDDAWDEVPLRPGDVGEVVGWDEVDECPIIRGPKGQKGMHPRCIRHAPPGVVEAAERLAREQKEVGRRPSVDEYREIAKREAQKAAGTNLDPTAAPWVPPGAAPPSRAAAAPAAAAPAAPAGPECRIDPATGKPATKEEFMANYGREAVWERAAPAPARPVETERRYDPYTLELLTELEFLNRYGKASYWNEASRYDPANPTPPAPRPPPPAPWPGAAPPGAPFMPAYGRPPTGAPLPRQPVYPPAMATRFTSFGGGR